MLLDSKGNKFAKATPPKKGDAFASWAGRDEDRYITAGLPGNAVLQFDLSRLKLADFRQMSYHYQINSSLNLLAFMQHQAKWKIVHPNKKVRDLLTENLQQIWTQLIRARTQANWSGYAPSVLEWDNYSYDNTTRITKIKDLLPEEALVHWKEVPLWAPPGQIPPKQKIYDGIDKFGQNFPIPKENTFWYPLLMQNGNYYGRKLLKSVFTPYFFSMLVHMYANRYFERFGQPTPIGRAPFDDDIVVNGKTYSGSDLMEASVRALRSGGVVLLPSDKTHDGSGAAHYDYDIEYLESQMRGADFERMLTRYDQEMALGTFTPLLLQQTADVGSYNLGGLHYQMYLMTQNAMNADFGMFVEKFILRPITMYNFAQSTEPAKLEFEQQDNSKADLVKMIIQAMISGGNILPDIDELGEAAGMTLHEVQQVKTPVGGNDPTQTPPNDPSNPGGRPANDSTGSGSLQDKKVPEGQTSNPSNNAAEIRGQLFERVRNQVQNARDKNIRLAAAEINIPFTKKIAELYGKGHGYAIERGLGRWSDEAVREPWRSAEEFANAFIGEYDKLTRL